MLKIDMEGTYDEVNNLLERKPNYHKEMLQLMSLLEEVGDKKLLLSDAISAVTATTIDAAYEKGFQEGMRFLLSNAMGSREGLVTL
ncbi:MAG TPA: hypothetical protein GX523_06670 [Desulfitobacterium dehalogenans]|uniref:Uncharacterized protein n=1 Tax=Desulfitobacterium dehalogenans TaxID=36854 RepID=A0A7C7D914_9FIRM|nr:hypothetical protein [Desulfitobacterium dehalogenans]